MGGAVLALHLARSSASNEPILPNLAAAALMTLTFERTTGQIGLGARVDRAAARWCALVRVGALWCAVVRAGARWC